MIKGRTINIVPHDGGWIVYGCDTPQMRLYFSQQEEALEYANNYVTTNDGRLLIHQAQTIDTEAVTLLMQMEQQFTTSDDAERVPVTL